MQLDGGRETAAAEDAAVALLGMADRITALAEVEWHSPAAILFRAVLDGIADDCAELRLRLATYVPDEW